MEADLTTGDSLADRTHAWLERGFARVCVVPKSLRGSKDQMGPVQVQWADYVAAAAASAVIAVRMTGYASAERIPGVRE
jgi:hypothetical protein